MFLVKEIAHNLMITLPIKSANKNKFMSHMTSNVNKVNARPLQLELSSNNMY